MDLRIAIIGTGNVGTWLLRTFQTQNFFTVASFSSRKIETVSANFDLYVFALKDDVYELVLQQIPFIMPYAVHTSGSLSQNILARYSKQFGVLYPYQSISNAEKVEIIEENYYVMSYDFAPICVEGSNPEFEEILFNLSKAIFQNVYKVKEKQRFAMHLAAVFANNFTNAMYGIAYNIFKENNLDWSLIYPLLENTLEKAKNKDPHLSQTGPAIRKDVSIMEKHCNTLNNTELETLYRLVSKIIQK